MIRMITVCTVNSYSQTNIFQKGYLYVDTGKQMKKLPILLTLVEVLALLYAFHTIKFCGE